MFNFGDIITVNTRKVKKLVKGLSGYYDNYNPQTVKSSIAISESYRGRFVVLECREGQIVAISHCPEYPHLHNRVRNVPASLARRIRKANEEHLKLLEVK